MTKDFLITSLTLEYIFAPWFCPIIGPTAPEIANIKQNATGSILPIIENPATAESPNLAKTYMIYALPTGVAILVKTAGIATCAIAAKSFLKLTRLNCPIRLCLLIIKYKA